MCTIDFSGKGVFVAYMNFSSFDKYLLGLAPNYIKEMHMAQNVLTEERFLTLMLYHTSIQPYTYVNIVVLHFFFYFFFRLKCKDPHIPTSPIFTIRTHTRREFNLYNM